MAATPLDRDQRGFSLPEVLVALALIATVVLTAMMGLLASTTASNRLRVRQQLSQAITNYGELLQSESYVDCATTATFPDPLADLAEFPPEMTASVTGVAYWNDSSSSYGPTCAPDPGAQALTLSVSLFGADETAVVVRRKP